MKTFHHFLAVLLAVLLCLSLPLFFPLLFPLSALPVPFFVLPAALLLLFFPLLPFCLDLCLGLDFLPPFILPAALGIPHLFFRGFPGQICLEIRLPQGIVDRIRHQRVQRMKISGLHRFRNGLFEFFP